MAERFLKQGPGWRLGWDPSAITFTGLVGADDWALELTAAELADFCRLLQQLVSTLQQIRWELMESEKICCEASSELIWLEVDGDPDAFTLRLLVLSGRRGEGFWPVGVGMALLQATQNLPGF